MRYSYTFLGFTILLLLSIMTKSDAQVQYSIGPVGGFGMANYPHQNIEEKVDKVGGDVIPGIHYSLGVSQQLKINRNWALEMEVGIHQANFEMSEEFLSMDFLTGQESDVYRGHHFKLTSLNVPIKIRYSNLDKRNTFSIFGGIAYRQNKKNRLTYFSESTNLSTGEMTSRTVEIKDGNMKGPAYLSSSIIDDPNRFFWVGGFGCVIPQAFYLDLEVNYPWRENSIMYNLIGWERYVPFMADFRDSTLTLKIGYWFN